MYADMSEACLEPAGAGRWVASCRSFLCGWLKGACAFTGGEEKGIVCK